MAAERYTHKLTGCAPIPLAHYLKALGILRLVGEQADEGAQGWWSGDVFFLRTTLDRTALIEFLLERYSPTPIVGPWGARSGFFPSSSENSARAALNRIAESMNPRLERFSTAIREVRRVLDALGLQKKADGDAEKLRLMVACRAELPDELLPWLDTTYVLLAHDRKFPPLLGTGGNEGSGSYMSGFAQQVVDVLLDRKHDEALTAAVLGETSDGTSTNQTPGHFSPNDAGGPNASQGFEGGLTTNAWDYILALEGTLLFASAAVRQLESRDDGSLGYPFCVRPTAAGYGSSATSDEGTGRAEMWLPLWTRPTSLPELRLLFSEGRATVNQRAARNGVDFARAISMLGVDRGITDFERFGFHQRNGLSNFAVPFGRFRVRAKPAVGLIDQIDDWISPFRRAATGKNAPSSARRALRDLEDAVFQFCKSSDPDSVRLQRVITALAVAESVVARSTPLRVDNKLRPLQLQSPEWLVHADDGSPEFRLAASLAGLNSKLIGGFRQHLEPVNTSGRWPSWNEDSSALCDVVWTEESLESNLVALLLRRNILAVQRGERAQNTLVFSGSSRFHASSGDVGLFLREQTDDAKVASLAHGLSLLDWRNIDPGTSLQRGSAEPMPDATFALLKLCHSSHGVRDAQIPLEPRIARLLLANRLAEATKLAAQRLIGSGLPPAFKAVSRSGSSVRRIAAALMFPIGWQDIQVLAENVLKPPVESQSA
jgi:CRISPR-associated protein Csx17